MAKPKRPTWFKVCDYQIPFILAMPPVSVGKAFTAGLEYFNNGTMPKDLDPMETALFTVLKANADDAFEDFRRSVEGGKKGSERKKQLQNQKPPLPPPKRSRRRSRSRSRSRCRSRCRCRRKKRRDCSAAKAAAPPFCSSQRGGGSGLLYKDGIYL